MQLRLSSLFVALGLAFTSAEKLPITQCGADRLGIQNIDVNALPVKAGTPLVLTLSVLPTQDVTGGTVIVNAKLMGMALNPYKVDLCTGAKLKCPLKAGEVSTATVTYNIPSYAPTSTVEAHITAVDKANTPLACADAKIDLVNTNRKNPNLRYM